MYFCSMYNPSYFKEPDGQKVIQFIKDHPFAFLCGADATGRPAASQVPVFLDEKEGRLFLSGHISRKSDHHKAFIENPQVLAVFTGAHSYVSASWYENKQIASTWNYISVHARGKMTFPGEQELLNVLKRTTNYFENNPYSGANFEDLPADYVQKMAKAIVAFEVEVEELDHIFKLSQNRDEKSYDNIIEKLGQRDADAREISEIMSQRKKDVFK
jgi:transcriptional regulator